MLIWSTPVAISNSAEVPLAGAYCRLQITALPVGASATADIDPQYRGLGIVAPMAGLSHLTTEAILFQDQTFGPFPDAVDHLYYSLRPGVTGTLSVGYEMTDVEQPSALLQTTVVTTLANAANVPIPWSLQLAGIGLLWSVAAPTRLTCRAAGLYFVDAIAFLPTATYTLAWLRVNLNGANYRYLARVNLTGNGVDPVALGGSLLMPLNLGDYIEIMVHQESTASRDMAASSAVDIVRLSDI